MIVNRDLWQQQTHNVDTKANLFKFESSKTFWLVFCLVFQLMEILCIDCSCLLTFFQENFVKMIRDRHPHVGFLHLLSAKCIFNIFSSEHAENVLDCLSRGRFGGRHLEVFSIKLLMVRMWCYSF